MSPPYECGYRAYLDGVPDTDCPFAFDTAARGKWFEGWLDARTAVKFGELFAKWGVR